MKIVTLNQNLFNKKCKELYKKVSNHTKPTHIIFIENGGLYILDSIKELIEDSISIDTIKVFRPSSSFKSNKLIKFILKILPPFVSNILRRLEHYKSSNFRTVNRGFVKNQKLERVIKNISINHNTSILIMDDAIDSGSTIKLTKEYLLSLNQKLKNSHIFVACITRTQENPIAKPDFTIYEDILCRFPWSHDFK